MKAKIQKFINKNRYGIIMLSVAFIVAVLDLVSKAVTDGKARTIIDGFISVFSSHNTGAAWSMMSNHTWLLIVLSILFIGVILVANYLFKSKNVFYSIAMGLVISGALCNLFDRIVFGYVRDFISLDFINFPIFNLADCAITLGVILLIIFFILLNVNENKLKKMAIKNSTESVDVEKSNQTINQTVELEEATTTKADDNQIIEEKITTQKASPKKTTQKTAQNKALGSKAKSSSNAKKTVKKTSSTSKSKKTAKSNNTKKTVKKSNVSINE